VSRIGKLPALGAKVAMNRPAPGKLEKGSLKRKPDMITLYHCAAARSFRPLWTLEELGLSDDLKMLPFPPRVLAKDYLALNPLGTIPLLLDGDTRMTESAAIAQYLVTRYGPTPLAVEMDEPDFGAFLNWLHFGEATLTFPQTLVLRYSQLEPEARRNPQVATDYAKWFFGRLRGLEAAIATRDMLCGGRFIAADISVGYALLLAQRIGLSRDFTPGVAAYWQRMQQREGYRRAVAAENLASAQQNVPFVFDRTPPTSP
jgi:glutathione S-transferase